METLFEDDAHLLTSRSVIKIEGDNASKALQPLLSNSLADVKKGAVFAYVLTPAGGIRADVFVVWHEDSLLVDCSTAQASYLLEKLRRRAANCGVTVTDAADSWRVLGILPSQGANREGSFVKYADPRLHMGARLMRPRSDPESSRWEHEINWVSHCYRLGYLPDASIALEYGLTVAELGVSARAGLHADHVGTKIRAFMERRGEPIKRRVLPVRIEPVQAVFPTLTQKSILARGEEVAKILAHRGVFGLALVDIDQWRSALDRGEVLTSEGQYVSFTWPTWCANESQGRGGPLARQQSDSVIEQ